MADAGARRHHLEVVERLLAPFAGTRSARCCAAYSSSTLLLESAFGVPNSSTITEWSIDEVDRDQRVDLGGIAAEPR